MCQPLVSVIIPVYNSEKTIKSCLQSVQNQSYINIEIIIINDGSQDKSIEVIKEILDEDGRISVYSQNNMGLVAARKKGVEVAKGDLIGFVDSDDWIESQMYEKLVNAYIETDSDIISSGIIRDYEGSGNRKCLFDNFPEGLYENLDTTFYFKMLYDYEARDYGLYCTLVNKLYKKNLLKEVYVNINTKVFYGEDCMTIYPCCLMARKIYILHEAFYHYIIREDSMCHAVNPQILSNVYLLFIELKKAFMCYKEPYILMGQLKKFILQMVIRNHLNKFFDIDIDVYSGWQFNFDMSVFDSTYIIYGAGICGQALYSILGTLDKRKNMVAWVDKYPEGKSDRCLYTISGLDEIIQNEYEHIVIAVKDRCVAYGIKKELVEKFGVEKNKIIWEEVESIPAFEDIIF